MNYYMQTMESPIGQLYLVANDTSLCAVTYKTFWSHDKVNFKNYQEIETPLLGKTKLQLKEYFDKKRRAFDLPLEMHGTDFQKRAWRALSRIPFGETWTYQQQANVINSPKAVRAVGRANGLNPLSIIVPCHRVIGSNGTLTGYAGGLDVKKYLLALEGLEIDKAS